MTPLHPMTAVAAARMLEREAHTSGDAWFWLDGEAAAPGEARVSYLGLASETRESVPGREREFLEELRDAEIASIVATPSTAHESDAAARSNEDSLAGFAAGWIVALGYEFGVGLLGGEPHPDEAAPACALRAEAVLTIDHESGHMRISGSSDAAARLDALLRGSEAAPLRGPAPSHEPATSHEPAPSRGAHLASASAPLEPAGPVATWRDDAYEAHVEECRGAIRRGDAYVLCLTDTASATTNRTPLDLYSRLRGTATREPLAPGVGPAPAAPEARPAATNTAAMRGAVIVLPHRALVSASPERFLSVHGTTVTTHPIKGTRPRGLTPAQDSALASELRRDPKERAENLMIVDLMRNDLSRVCEVGSVRVSRFLAVESHPRVHQLVSTIEGQLAAGHDVFDAIAACFPGGSMTGAPKRSAVAILGALERGPRGLYSGCFGWISDNGDAELAMTIRGIELRPGATGSVLYAEGSGALALVGAGGGITVDSDPHRERAERDLKAQALLTAL